MGDKQVICGLSGGVDSSVVAALLYRAIGSQLSCIFVDNGLLRKGEADEVEHRFGEHFKTDLHVVDAKDLFLSELKGVVDPQEKRKIIGRLFIEVFQKEAKSIKNAHFLAQGTLYPDVIESGANKDGQAATIKLHHNVGGLPEKLGFELLPGEHPIVPVMLHDAAKAAKFAEAMLAQGVYVVAFSFPVVPRGKARIRTQMSAALSDDDIQMALEAFGRAKAVTEQT